MKQPFDFLQKINSLPGYDLFEESTSTLSQPIGQFRLRKGLSIEKLGMILGIDPTTLAGVGRVRSAPSREIMNLQQAVQENIC